MWVEMEGGRAHWWINRENGQAVFVGGGYFVSVIGAVVTDLQLRGAHCPTPVRQETAGAHSHKGGFYIFRCETRETTCEDSSATARQLRTLARTLSLSPSIGGLTAVPQHARIDSVSVKD